VQWTNVHVNAHALARYAALCQEQGLVPIVEPEVLMDRSHTIERCEEVTGNVLRATFYELGEQRLMPRRHVAEAEHGHRGKAMPTTSLRR
jgi:fructose-bisphosphate aldolase class I